MDDVANYADDVIVMHDGKAICEDTPSAIFNNQKLLTDGMISLPQSARFAQKLSQKQFTFDKLPITLGELSTEIKQQINGD